MHIPVVLLARIALPYLALVFIAYGRSLSGNMFSVVTSHGWNGEIDSLEMEIVCHAPRPCTAYLLSKSKSKSRE
jgi:hypothetical protein